MIPSRCRLCGAELLDPVGVLTRGLALEARGEGGLKGYAEIALLQLLGICCWNTCEASVVHAFAVLLGAQRLAREASCAR